MYKCFGVQTGDHTGSETDATRKWIGSHFQKIYAIWYYQHKWVYCMYIGTLHYQCQGPSDSLSRLHRLNLKPVCSWISRLKPTWSLSNLHLYVVHGLGLIWLRQMIKDTSFAQTQTNLFQTKSIESRDSPRPIINKLQPRLEQPVTPKQSRRSCWLCTYVQGLDLIL